MLTVLTFLAGIAAGAVAGWWAMRLVTSPISGFPQSPVRCVRCQHPSRFWIPRIRARKCEACHQLIPRWPIPVCLLTAVAFAAFSWLLVKANCQTITEVRPAAPLWSGRLPFHLLLLFFLLSAVITDYLDYVIPDEITWTGVLLAVTLATVSGELQMVHIWVDWSDPLVSLYGPWLPQWMKEHQHLHGFVWSVSGMAMGAGLTQSARFLAQFILGFPAMGSGDVTLMAMIGGFMGWQPVLCVLALAPIAGILAGLPTYIVAGRSYIAFGPSLCAAAVAVLCLWRSLWETQQLRIVFSHGPTVAGLVGGCLLLYACLLAALRLFRAAPPEKLRR
jgi:leader peptidase (prepilin peptidase)/N-methyltransferase